MFTDKTANMITIKKKNPTTAITIKDTTIKGIITRRIITKGIMKKDTIILMKAQACRQQFYMRYVIINFYLSRRNSEHWAADIFAVYFLSRIRQRRSCLIMERLALSGPHFHICIFCCRYCLNFSYCKKLLFTDHGSHAKHLDCQVIKKRILVISWSYRCA